MTKPLKPVLLLALLLLGAAACGRGVGVTPGSPDAWPTGRTFWSVSVTEGGKDRPLVAGTRIVLSFSDQDRLGAVGGCNHLGGTGHIADGVLFAEITEMTEMACDEPRMQQDTWLGNFLSAEPTWQLSGDQLTLRGGSVEIKLVDRKVLDPDRPLAGTRWQVDTLLQGQVAYSVPEGYSAYLEFDTSGVLRGNTGCMEIHGQVLISADQIMVTTLATMPPCDPQASVSAQAQLHAAVAATLALGTISYKIDGRSLTLTRTSGDGLVLRAT